MSNEIGYLNKRNKTLKASDLFRIQYYADVFGGEAQLNDSLKRCDVTDNLRGFIMNTTRDEDAEAQSTHGDIAEFLGISRRDYFTVISVGVSSETVCMSIVLSQFTNPFVFRHWRLLHRLFTFLL